ncbi:ComF family protein [Streptococcus pacificus]|uniref:ComF family protein n=1 Tax=Streptococcus pacificus TaxID=2740577 RepID=A0ABS0ZIL0_9STRE|nr:ComF family protein [Streptococcus pacificus]MBJ8325678.1 ComF family protein [Streptococcus pacificus]
MNCLLCGQQMVESFKISEIMLLQKETPTVCNDCLSQFTKIPDCHCPLCFKEGSSEICDDCHYWEKKGVKPSHQSLYLYNDAMKNFFSQYKFEGDYLLRKVFSRDIKNFFKNYKNYTIVPIPTTEKRFSQRQFNQVIGLLDAAKIAYQDILIKNESIAQSKKTKIERLSTTDLFKLKSKVKTAKNILLVDDIYTTGATIASVQKLLYQNGVRKVISFSLAR